jgi:uncharacterized membrane protein
MDYGAKLVGMEIILGWQMDRITAALPRIGIVVAATWVIVGVAFRDWSIATGFGQFVIASLTLLVAAPMIK